MPFGILDTSFIDFPANVDEAYIRGLETRSGLQFTDVLDMVDDRLGAFNGVADPLVAELVYPTTLVNARSTSPVSFKVDERGEYTMARPQFTKGQGHMLPIRGYEVAVGFTEEGLLAMPLADIEANVDSMLLGYRRLHRLKVLERLFSPDEVRVDDETTVTSPGFAGSGTGANVLTGAYPNGQPYENDFSLYYAADTDGGVAAVEAILDAAIVRRRKLDGDQTIYDLDVSEAFLTLLKTSGKWTDAGSALIRTGSGTDVANVDSARYAGVYDGKVRVRHAIQEITSAHAALRRASTAFSPENPLAWRYDPQKGRNAYVRYRDFFPLANAMLLQDFGIGVSKRTAISLLYAASGANAYVAPTFAVE